MKRIILITFSIIQIFNLSAQEALLAVMEQGTQMSLNTLQGTARFVGTGGVLGTVGGDISNLNTNPAGLAMFSKSEFEITPTLAINNVNNNYQLNNGSSLQSNTIDNNRYKFLFNSLGLVIANRQNENLRASNVTIGLNRIADFNRTINFGVEYNYNYNYSNYLSDLATIYKDPLPGNLPIIGNYKPFRNDINRTLIARRSELVFYDNTSNLYVDPTTYNGGDTRQFGQQKTTGGINEFSVAWSANIKDKYYLGFSLGIPFLTHKKEFYINEDNYGATVASPNQFYGKFRGYTMTETEKNNGVGVNLKFGGLVKINENLKASAYVHTPTYYEITNNYSISMTSEYENSTSPQSQELEEFVYNYIIPFKAGGGMSYLFKKRGFIGIEYEFNNLDNLNLVLENKAYDESSANQKLKANNQDVHTIRIGGEFAVENFRIRGGYNLRTSPKESNVIEYDGNMTMHTYTGGLGYRGKSFSIDLAYMKNQFSDFDFLYGNNQVEFGNKTWNSNNQVSATFNFRFN